MITRAIENCLRTAKEKGWPKTYWAFDIHGTILKPNYKPNEISTEFYPYAKEVLQALRSHAHIVKILYTCSYPHEIEQYLEYFGRHDIHFEYVNQNPEVCDGGYGYYKSKFYFNVLMDDKAGFEGERDWKLIMELIRKENGAS